tara:strand:- start:207 stop:590 length:384 start_codon:yes stop_codon:yes gene_type:complete
MEVLIMYKSETFGRIFWVDDDYEFQSCPLNVDGTGDFNCSDYVSEWDDWEGVDMDKLFNIHKFCIINKLNYAGSITHNETPKVTNKEEDSMREYKWDEQFYNEIVKDSTFSYGKFTNPDYPLHLQQQ